MVILHRSNGQPVLYYFVHSISVMKSQAADYASSICKSFASDVLLNSTFNVRRVARHLYWEVQGKPQSTLRALTPSAVPYFHIHT